MASRAADTSFVRSSKTEKWESFKTVEILHNCIAFRTGPRRCRRLIGCMHLGGSALRAVWLSVSIGSVVTSGFAQLDTGDLRVTVRDTRGAIIRDAAVTVADEARGSSRTIKTIGDGQAVFRSLTPGLYTVSVEAPGFAKTLANNVRLTIGQSAELPVILPVA